MSDEKIELPTEELRTPLNMAVGDSRNYLFNITSPEQLYDDIARFTLNKNVPEHIVIQYDTARNLYLYSFHVYRFYNVAQQHLFSALELAIKDGIGEDKLKKFAKSRGARLGLSICMQYLRDKKIISNSDFPRWHNRNRAEAEAAYSHKVIEQMVEKGLDEYIWNESEIEQSTIESQWDLVDVMCRTMPKIRNEFAHGSTTLFKDVLVYFDDISIIINKVYAHLN
ncbi:hypothetical protein [Shewanella gaetbuli]|uniref:Uncharacterized protein n=1 Tax=Shewanella gaetbuli TaxID=220752 RepID=A0A9X1ZI10_9GAMM|nr:hypothetical protein [Shewanella gaetbuli]MCL1142689.1 hypothetical protein [Shewanella gaetbuli]